MHQPPTIVALALLFACSATLHAAETFSPPLFVFSNGVAFGNPAQEAATLKQLGYQGIGSAPINKLAERLAAYRAQGVKVFSIYVALGDPKIPDAIELLKGTGATIELTVRKPLNDEAVEEIRELAKLAADAELRIAFYPHHGFTIATIDPAIQLAKRVDRPNVGLMFNLCHYLKNEKPDDLEATLERAAPYLFAVSTCGADTDGNNWNKLIQPLDAGTFDQTRLLRALKNINFTGAVGLQCYAVKGDKKDNLTRSMTAWRKILEKVNE